MIDGSINRRQKGRLSRVEREVRPDVNTDAMLSGRQSHNRPRHDMDPIHASLQALLLEQCTTPILLLKA